MSSPRIITPENMKRFAVIKYNESPETIAQNEPLAYLWKSIAKYDDSAALKWKRPHHDEINADLCVVIPLYAHRDKNSGALIALDYENIPYVPMNKI